MTQFKEIKRKHIIDLSEEDIKEIDDYLRSFLKDRLNASKKNKVSMLIHLRSGETISYLLSDIDDISFEKSCYRGIHGYVDLGLSVNWAKCNIGAAFPEKYGDYYAWGESEKKNCYSEINYKFYTKNRLTFTKYSRKIQQIEIEDDVAHIKWGGNWRLPQPTEFDELREQCTWEWTSINNVKGYKVISNKPGYEGNFIFLPAAGMFNKNEYIDSGSNGYYWTNYNAHYNRSFRYEFSSDLTECNNFFRYYGLSVRPVCPKKTT